jgi:hypothetical protein
MYMNKAIQIHTDPCVFSCSEMLSILQSHVVRVYNNNNNNNN